MLVFGLVVLCVFYSRILAKKFRCVDVGPETKVRFEQHVGTSKEEPSFLLSGFRLFDADTEDPIIGCTCDDFEIQEDGMQIGRTQEQRCKIISGTVPGSSTVSLLILVDASTSVLTDDPEMRQDLLLRITSAVQHLIENELAIIDHSTPTATHIPVSVSIALFDGRHAPYEVVTFRPFADGAEAVRHSSDLASPISTFEGEDACSTNLNGAVVHASETLMQQVEEVMDPVPHPIGFLVLFSDGVDTAGRVEAQRAIDAIDLLSPAYFVFGFDVAGTTSSVVVDVDDEEAAVDVDDSDFGDDVVVDEGGKKPSVLLEAIARDGAFAVDRWEDIKEHAGVIRDKIDAIQGNDYLLAFCSPKRAGKHTYSVKLRYGQMQNELTAEYDATGFASGCRELENLPMKIVRTKDQKFMVSTKMIPDSETEDQQQEADD